MKAGYKLVKVGYKHRGLVGNSHSLDDDLADMNMGDSGLRFRIYLQRDFLHVRNVI